MKKLLLATLTLFHLLILPAFSSQCLAAPTMQIGATTDLLSNDKPVLGVLGIEYGPARVTAGAGYNGRGEGAFDLIARSRSGVYVGFGIFSEKTTEYESTSDTLTTSKPGKGHGYGRKKHAHKGGKVIINSFTFRGDYASYPTALVGVASRRLYGESRMIFGTSDFISAQASLGFRW